MLPGRAIPRRDSTFGWYKTVQTWSGEPITVELDDMAATLINLHLLMQFADFLHFRNSAGL
jgi:hypothetical protein